MSIDALINTLLRLWLRNLIVLQRHFWWCLVSITTNIHWVLYSTHVPLSLSGLWSVRDRLYSSCEWIKQVLATQPRFQAFSTTVCVLRHVIVAHAGQLNSTCATITRHKNVHGSMEGLGMRLLATCARVFWQ